MMKTLKYVLSIVLLLTAGAWCQSVATGSVTTSGSTCTTAGACVSSPVNQNTGGAMIQLSGTFSGTVQFESSVDNVTWVAINGTPLNGTTSVSSATTANIWQFNVAGAAYLRARCSSFSSGPILIAISFSTASARSRGSNGSGIVTVAVNGTTISSQAAGSTTVAVNSSIFSTNLGAQASVNGVNV